MAYAPQGEPLSFSMNARGGRGSVVRRDASIDTLRGIAIILMVAGHVVGGDSSEGMRVADDSSWRTGYLLLEDLRIPLFTALSGFVYAMRPIGSASQLPKLGLGKVRRLLVPLVVVATVFGLLQVAAPGTNSTPDMSKWWMIYVYGHWHFWFLQAIFLLLLGIAVANAFGKLRTARSTLVTICVTGVIAIFVHVPFPFDVFSINGAIRLAPFFLLGYATSRFSEKFAPFRNMILVFGLGFFVVRSYQVLSGAALPAYVDAMLGLLLGLSGISALILFRGVMQWWPLARLGYFSFAIYLLHVFGTAPTRMLLNRLGVDSEIAVFAGSLLLGLALPVLFECTFGRVGWVSWMTLGQKPYRGVKSTGARMAREAVG